MKKKIKISTIGYITKLDLNNIEQVLEYNDFTSILEVDQVYKDLKIAKSYFDNPAYGYTSEGIKFKKVKVTVEEI